MRGGWYSFEAKYIRDFPIPKQHGNIDLIISKAKKIIIEKNRNTDTSPLEAEIDLLVYHLYELTYEEVLLVDPEFALTEEAYNNHNQK